MKNRTVIGIICIAVALVLCFGVAPLITRLADGSVEVVRVKAQTTIDSGTEITEDLLEIYKGKKSDFSDGTYYTYQVFKSKYLDSSSSDYVGRAFAKCEMTAGEFISQSKVSANAADAGSVFEGLGYSQMAMSVEISSFADGLSGKLENGDIVSVVVESSDTGAMIPQELTFVKVITTTTATGVDKNRLTKNEDGSYNDSVTTVTLLVNEEQATVLKQYASNATFALRCKGSSTMAETYLEDQQRMLDEINGIYEEPEAKEETEESETKAETVQEQTTAVENEAEVTVAVGG